MDYRVTWDINIEADTPVEAAKKALEIHRDPNSTADVFYVAGPEPSETMRVDLTAERENEGRDNPGIEPDRLASKAEYYDPEQEA